MSFFFSEQFESFCFFHLRFLYLQLGEEKPSIYKDVTSDANKQLHCQIVNSSWCGLLAALTPLIDAATDESITENVLKALQNYAALCGTLGIIHFF